MAKYNSLQKAKEWIANNTIRGKGIVVTSKQRVIYPEVSGYFIPTLLRWNEKELAIRFAEHLCSIQKEDGSWYDPTDSEPYVFDSAQILKGLIAIRDILPEVDAHIIKGVDWILTNLQPNGRLTTPSHNAWGKNEDFCSELIHIYCLEPIRDAGIIFGKSEYTNAVSKILNFYKNERKDKILNFSLLSHFYAYVMEGLFDLGEIEMCREAMNNIKQYDNHKGYIPGLNNVSWVCSTGLFQLAIVWYKLGDIKQGNKLFSAACNLQNSSGGWFGSYPPSKIDSSKILKRFLLRGKRKPYYFPDEEISWAVKYFLDALYYKNQLEGKNN